MLLGNGANPRVHGACAMMPLDMATFEEHEAVVQQQLAADEDSKSEMEIIEDNEPGDTGEVEISTPPLHSDLDDISETSQEGFGPQQASRAPDNSDSETLQPQLRHSAIRQPHRTESYRSATAPISPSRLTQSSPSFFSSLPNGEHHGAKVRRWFRIYYRFG